MSQEERIKELKSKIAAQVKVVERLKNNATNAVVAGNLKQAKTKLQWLNEDLDMVNPDASANFNRLVGPDASNKAAPAVSLPPARDTNGTNQAAASTAVAAAKTAAAASSTARIPTEPNENNSAAESHANRP